MNAQPAFHHVIHNTRFKRYVLVGGSVYVLEIALITIGQALGMSPVLAVAVSFWIGLLVSFGLQKLVTFGDRRLHHHILLPQFLAFAALVLFNFGFTLLLTAWLAGILPVIIIRTVAIGLCTIWNFYLYRTRIFKSGDGVIY